MRSVPALLAAAVLLGVGTAPAHAAGWSRPLTFHAGTARFDEPVPRVAIAPDGTSVLSYVRGRDLFARLGDTRGRFSAPQRLGRWRSVVTAPAAASGGRALVAFEGEGGIRVAVRTRAGRRLRVRLLAPSGSEQAINDLAAAADPRGGWFLTESRFSKRSRGDAIHAFTLRSDGTPALRERVLAQGQFGADANPVRALAVDAGGHATAAWNTSGGPYGVVYADAVHAGRFGAPTTFAAGVTAVRVAPSSDGDGRALLTGITPSRCGDAGCSGQPVAARLSPSGAPAPLRVPTVAFPNRVFGPSIAAVGGGDAVLVWSEKATPAAFSREAPVKAAVLHDAGRPGGVQTLTPGLATEPIAASLAGGRVLAAWAGRRGWGMATSVRGGHFHPTTPPTAPPPEPYHTNPTNRALDTAGRWAIVAWSRGGIVRVVRRRF